MNVQYITLLRLENDNALVKNCYIFLVCDPKHRLCGTSFALKHILWVCTIFVIHGQETRDYSASFAFLNWRPPLPLID